MIVVVTGGRGLIGRNVIEKFLSQGHSVRALSRSIVKTKNNKLKWFTGDLDSSELLDSLVIDADIVCHCAGEINNEEQFININYYGTIQIVEASLRAKVRRFIHISSVGVYGNNLHGNINEKSPLSPMNAYEKSKIMADEWLISLKPSVMDIVILRPSTIFDIKMTNQSLKNWIQAIHSGRFFFIGKKNSLVNYVHIGTVKDAISLVATSPLPKKINIYNISHAITIEKFVENVCFVTNVKYPKIRIPFFLILSLSFIMDLAAVILNRKFSLSVSRVKALTSQVIYNSNKIKIEHNFNSNESLEVSLRHVTHYWINKKINE